MNKMTDMKEAVKQFKQENGNHSFTLKEMIMYNVTQINDLKEVVSTHLETAAAEDGKLRGKVSILTKMVYGIWGVIGILIAAVISKMK